MLKPQLKRKQQKEQETPERWSGGSYQTNRQKYYQPIIPKIFLTDYYQDFFTQKQCIWVPLSAQHINYPAQVIEFIQLYQSTIINNSKTLFWCYNETTLLIWRYQMNYEQYSPIIRSQFDIIISAVHAKTMNEINCLDGVNELVAIALDGVIKLYKIDKNQLEPLDITIKSSSSYIDQIMITIKTIELDPIYENYKNSINYNQDNNQVKVPVILYSDGLGYLSQFNLHTFQKSQTKPLYKKLLRAIRKQKQQMEILEIKPGKNRIFTLSKRQITNSTFKQLFYWLFRLNLPNLKQNLIKVYKWTKKGIEHMHTIPSSKVLEKGKDSYQEIFSRHQYTQSLYVCSVINRNDELVALLTNGYSILIKDTYNVSFKGKIQNIPMLPQKQEIGINIKTNKVEENQVLLGIQSIAILQNSTVVVQNNNIISSTIISQFNWNPIKIQKISQDAEGVTYQNINRWIILSRNSLYIFSSLRPTDLLIIYATVHADLLESSQMTAEDYTRIMKKIDYLANKFGYCEILVYIFQLLSLKKHYSVKIQKRIYNLALVQIQQKQPYKPQAGVRQLIITKQIEDKLWKYLLKYRDRKSMLPKYQKMEKSDSLWHAIMIIITDILSQIKNKSPQDFASNTKIIYKLAERLEFIQPILLECIQSYNKYKKQVKQKLTNINDVSILTAAQIEPKQSQSLSQIASTEILCRQIQKIIPKLKFIMEIYHNLSECDREPKKLPNFENTLNDRRSRLKFSKRLIQCFKNDNEPLLYLVESQVPEFELNLSKLVTLWDNTFQSNEQNIVFDPKTISRILDYQNDRKIENYFQSKQKYSQLTNIFIEKIRQTIMSKIQIENKKNLYNTNNIFLKSKIESLQICQETVEEQKQYYMDRILKWIQLIIQKTRDNKNSKVNHIKESVELIYQSRITDLKIQVKQLLQKKYPQQVEIIENKQEQKRSYSLKKQYIRQQILNKINSNEK